MLAKGVRPLAPLALAPPLAAAALIAPLLAALAPLAPPPLATPLAALPLFAPALLTLVLPLFTLALPLPAPPDTPPALPLPPPPPVVVLPTEDGLRAATVEQTSMAAVALPDSPAPARNMFPVRRRMNRIEPLRKAWRYKSESMCSVSASSRCQVGSVVIHTDTDTKTQTVRQTQTTTTTETHRHRERDEGFVTKMCAYCECFRLIVS